MTVSGKEEEENADHEPISVAMDNEYSGSLGIRHLQTLLLFLGMTIGYCLRTGISVAIVAMTSTDNSSAVAPGAEVYDWNSNDKSLILSSFFWGYTVSQVPSGYIAGTWSAKKLLSIGMSICGILNILTPIGSGYGGLPVVCACRVGMGLCQGCLLPCVHTLLSKWAPPSERARLGTFAYAGGQFGTVIALPISGLLAGSSIGWPYIFYVFGILAIFWSIIFYLCGADAPSEHNRISEKERRYIENSLGQSRRNTDGTADLEEKSKIPWKCIFTSVPMWAIIIAHCGQNWGYWMLLTEMPTYMKSILKYDIEENGLISALPYLVMWILSFPVSWLSDYALKKGVSRAVARKVSNTIAHWGPGIALLILGIVRTNDKTLAVAILVIAVGLNAGSLCGFQINHIDLSPNFAGTMMSITNCIAAIVAIIAPLISGKIVQNEENISMWATVFNISAGIYFAANLIFIVFGKAEVQWWNNPQDVNPPKRKNELTLTIKLHGNSRTTPKKCEGNSSD